MALTGVSITESALRTTGRIRFDTNAIMGTFGSELASAANWVSAGVILAAKTGLDYRRMQNGELAEAEFNRNLRANSAGTVGSVVGQLIGVAIGLPLGGYVADTVGAVVGAVALGVTGGVVMEQAFYNAEQALEEVLAKQRAENQ